MPTPKKSTKPETAKKKAPARKPVQTGGSQIFDASLAAQAAARMVAARAGGKIAPSGGARHETSMFKQLKENVAKPHLGGIDTLLTSTAPPGTRPANMHNTGEKLAGHHQTVSTEASRRNVPRRTAG